MAGAPATMADKGIEKPMREQWQWQAGYSRCFTYPTSYLSNTSTTISPRVSVRKRAQFKPIWISSSGSSTEEHFISKLHFTWPQVSCLSGFPARGSLVVFASYIDSTDEKQKFALRFPTISEIEDFITSLEDIFSNKISKGLTAVTAITAASSESEFAPPYRPEMTSVMTQTYAFPMPNNSQTEDGQDSHAQDGVPDSESDVSAFPPRFTSLVSNCSAEAQQDNLALALAVPSESEGLNLRAQIVKYMQDSSFLGKLKVNHSEKFPIFHVRISAT
ncbi:hypothetical protein Cgig2_018247 [Carnegiea gigantea]|uniref:Poor homologous synapsis 1 PH domain-containing protein n=1 Tax=Carnegiea gigantea TaxID=171969 RepID=A0A9Q1KXY5_9CARY|nr:hypothetical protein Cgig2_018247 [Carnegiea gigantea]